MCINEDDMSSKDLREGVKSRFFGDGNNQGSERYKLS